MANQVEKLNTIAIADIEKVITLTDDNIEKINTLEFAGTATATVTYQGSAGQTGAPTAAYTFTSQPVGSGNRKIVVCAGQNGGTRRGISGITVGGNAMTQAVQAIASGNGDLGTWYYDATGATGSSVSIVLTFASTTENGCILIWTIDGAASGAAAYTAIDDNQSGINPVTNTISVPANGVLIAGMCDGNASTYTTTWAGPTEVFDGALQTYCHMSGASDDYESAQTGLTVSATLSSANNRAALAATAWGPPSTLTDVTVSFVASYVSTATATTYTFSSASIGTAAANRKVVVGISAITGDHPVSTVTVGGNSCSRVVATYNGANLEPTELWQVDLAAGTTGDIVVTFTSGGNMDCCGIGVWAVYGATGEAYRYNSDAARPAVATLDIPAGGVAIGVVGHRTNTTPDAYAWTNLTENYDETIQASTGSQSGASDAFAARQSALSITADATQAGARVETMAIASWGPVGVAEVALTANAVDSSSATAYTFSGQALGAAASDRIIVVGGFSTNAVQTVSSVTIGGVSATQVVAATNSGGEQCALWQAAVPSGTTGDIVWTWSGAEVGMGIGVWRIIGATASAHASSGVTGASALSSTLDIPENGVAIAYSGSASSSRTATWSGLSEVFDANGIEDGSASGNHTGASNAFDSAQTGLTIQMTLSGAPIRNPVLTMASWGPA